MSEDTEGPVEIAPGITVDREVSFGKPVIKGTRISIDIIMNHLAAGSSYEEIEDAYGLRREDILAVLGYAAEIISEEVVIARRR
jgi:uncharacterized protein (DUF433 family)